MHAEAWLGRQAVLTSDSMATPSSSHGTQHPLPPGEGRGEGEAEKTKPESRGVLWEEPDVTLNRELQPARHGLRPARPIWTAGYDKRSCFDDHATITRIRYVEHHNEAVGLPTRPWPFIEVHALTHPTATQIAIQPQHSHVQKTTTPPNLAPGH